MVPFRVVVPLHRDVEVVSVRDRPPDVGDDVDRSDALLPPRVSLAPSGGGATQNEKETHLVATKMPPLRHRSVCVDVEPSVGLLGGVLEAGEHVGRVNVRLEPKAG